MTQLIRYLILNLLGLSLAAFGAYTAVNHYPASGELAAWARVMPTVEAMLVFGLGVAALLVGVVMLAPALWRLQQRKARSTQSNAYARMPAPQSAPAQYDEDYGPESGSYAGDSYDDDSFRQPYRGNGEHRDYDGRRRSGMYR
jgi:hypothetical protein